MRRMAGRDIVNYLGQTPDFDKIGSQGVANDAYFNAERILGDANVNIAEKAGQTMVARAKSGAKTNAQIGADNRFANTLGAGLGAASAFGNAAIQGGFGNPSLDTSNYGINNDFGFRTDIDIGQKFNPSGFFMS